jgi:Mg2+ and Co2+ transporter CorA
VLDNLHRRSLGKSGYVCRSRFGGKRPRSGACCSGTIITAISRDDQFYFPGEPALELTDPAECREFTRRAVWIDLCEPTPEEEQVLEAALGLDVPTREEMQAIELSSRLYKEGNVLYLTATVLIKAQIERPESAAVTFILMPEQLVTLRYETPTAFQAFRARREANLTSYPTRYDILAGLIDAIIERIADILEAVGAHLDQISLEVFDADPRNSSTPDSSVRVQTVKSRGVISWKCCGESA